MPSKRQRALPAMTRAFLLSVAILSKETCYGFAPPTSLTTETNVILYSSSRQKSALCHSNSFPENETPSSSSSSSSSSSARRWFLRNLLVTSAALASRPAPSLAGTAAGISIPPTTSDLTWPLGKVAFSLLPLAGTYSRRATVEEEVVEGRIWTHDQIQGVVNVNVPVRQTVVKLSPEAGGGLLVHNPVAPTPQVIKMMRRLEKEHGPVRHIILATVALEHKATLGPFAQYFGKATVWLQPGQWSFPVNLPPAFTGVVQRGPKLREIPSSSSSSSHGAPEWSADFDYEVLGPLSFKSVGAFSETAFFHRDTHTLLVTDTVVSVTKTPPPIIREDPRAMLFHARDDIRQIVADDAATREKGWRRMVQFGLTFFPSQIDVVPFGTAVAQAAAIDPSMRSLGDGGVPFNLYPWTWRGDADAVNFETISAGGKLFCPPILTKLILDREPERTLEWVHRVARFDFTRVIPCHLNNDVAASPVEFVEAFDVLSSDPGKGLKRQRPLAEDLALLQKASDLLTRFNVVEISKVCDGEPARDVGRFADRK